MSLQSKLAASAAAAASNHHHLHPGSPPAPPPQPPAPAQPVASIQAGGPASTGSVERMIRADQQALAGAQPAPPPPLPPHLDLFSPSSGYPAYLSAAGAQGAFPNPFAAYAAAAAQAARHHHHQQLAAAAAAAAAATSQAGSTNTIEFAYQFLARRAADEAAAVSASSDATSDPAQSGAARRLNQVASGANSSVASELGEDATECESLASHERDPSSEHSPGRFSSRSSSSSSCDVTELRGSRARSPDGAEREGNHDDNQSRHSTSSAAHDNQRTQELDQELDSEDRRALEQVGLDQKHQKKHYHNY